MLFGIEVDNFSDPMVDCTESKSRFRADQLMWAKVELEERFWLGIGVSRIDTAIEDDRIVGYVSMASHKPFSALTCFRFPCFPFLQVEDGNVEKALEKAAKRLKKEQIDPHCDLLGLAVYGCAVCSRAICGFGPKDTQSCGPWG
ncbi:unnamed protein product [Effrenium voratum]|uniref:Uncharacterized protein n=1 Tax=Effrenium voratum TaxID=2562239 RepID=A0AA36HWW7_9DINO|nr:unnamed protein product [Effrenium voratum]